MKSLKLTAPNISSAEKKELTAQKSRLEEWIAAVEGDAKKVADLGKKQIALEKEAEGLHLDAAQFQRDAELKLIANQRILARVHDAIRGVEASAAEVKVPLWNALDQAQETVRRICQANYQQALDEVGAALAPFYTDFNEARWFARETPAVRDLVHVLLTHRASAYDSVERLVEAGRDTLRKIEACLTGSEIYSFSGAEAP